MPNLHSTVKKLRLAEQGLLEAAEAVRPADWNLPPRAGSWSAAHLVAHLCQVERGVLGYAERVIRKVPRPVPFFKRFHVPFAVVRLRLVRRETPIPLDAQLLAGKEIMLAELQSVRKKTLELLAQTRARDLRAYYWPHPFLGKLNFYNWFAFVAAHEIRHTKQLVEITKNLPKKVVTS